MSPVQCTVTERLLTVGDCATIGTLGQAVLDSQVTVTGWSSGCFLSLSCNCRQIKKAQLLERMIVRRCQSFFHKFFV